MKDKIEIEVVINIFTIEKGKVKMLLFRKKTEPYKGYWMLPTSTLDVEETLETRAGKIVEEQIGLKNVYLKQVKTFSDLDRSKDGRVLAVSYLGLVDSVSVEISNIIDDIESSWFSIDSIPKLAFDHEKIVLNSIDVLKEKLVDVNILKKLFPSDFTLPEIQKAYEQILGRTLDRRNFRKKFINLDLIEDTGYKNEGFNGRPAKLYKFKDDLRQRNLF